MRQAVGNLDARKVLGTAARLANRHGDIQAEIGNVGKWPARIEGQRRKNRENLFGEKRVQLRALFQTEFVQLQQADMILMERGKQIFTQEIVRAVDQPAHRGADRIQRLGRTSAIHAGFLHAVLDLLHDAGHAHHEKLVDVGAEDRQELHPLQQRIAAVARFFQNPPLELQVAEFAIQIERGIVQFGEICDFERRSGGFRAHVLLV